MSSTMPPITEPPANESANPLVSVRNVPITYPLNSPNSYCFGPQARLVDAVSEFSGGSRTIHPCKFITQLDTYFENVAMTSSQQLLATQRRLIGDAFTWYESLIPFSSSYTEFRQMFFSYFWSPTTQRKTRNDVFRPFRYEWTTGLAHHAMQWIASAKYLTPPIEPLDLVSTIIQHFPTSLSLAIRGHGPRTTNDLLAILTEFEESPSFCEAKVPHDVPRYPGRPNDQQESPGVGRFSNGRNPNNRDNRNAIVVLFILNFHLKISSPSVPAVQSVHQLEVSENKEATCP